MGLLHIYLHEWLMLMVIAGKYTPQKSTIDTKKFPFLTGVTFSKPSFWVSMLDFGGVPYQDAMGM